MPTKKMVGKTLIKRVKRFSENGRLSTETKKALINNGYYLTDRAIEAQEKQKFEEAINLFKKSSLCFKRQGDNGRAALCLREGARLLEKTGATREAQIKAYDEAGNLFVECLRSLKKGTDGFWTKTHLVAIDGALGCFRLAGNEEKYNLIKRYYNGEITNI